MLSLKTAQDIVLAMSELIPFASLKKREIAYNYCHEIHFYAYKGNTPKRKQTSNLSQIILRSTYE